MARRCGPHGEGHSIAQDWLGGIGARRLVLILNLAASPRLGNRRRRWTSDGLGPRAGSAAFEEAVMPARGRRRSRGGGGRALSEFHGALGQPRLDSRSAIQPSCEEDDPDR